MRWSPAPTSCSTVTAPSISIAGTAARRGWSTAPPRAAPDSLPRRRRRCARRCSMPCVQAHGSVSCRRVPAGSIAAPACRTPLRPSSSSTASDCPTWTSNRRSQMVAPTATGRLRRTWLCPCICSTRAASTNACGWKRWCTSHAMAVARCSRGASTRLPAPTRAHAISPPADDTQPCIRRACAAAMSVHVWRLPARSWPRMRAVSMTTQRSFKILPLLGWLTGALFFLYAWVLRVAPSVMVEELMRDFSVGAAFLGNMSAAYFYGYAGMQVPVGVLLDRFGPRRLIAISALLCAAGCVLFARADSLTTATTGRFLIGGSAAFSLVGAMAVAGQWFSPERFAMLSGLAMAAGMAGGVLGQAPLRVAVEASDWRRSMLLLAGGGVGLSLMAWASVRDRWRGSGGVGAVLRGLGAVARHPQTWLVALAGLGTSSPLLGFAGLWGVPFLETAHGMARTFAATLTSLLFVGWGVGAPRFGWLSDRIGRRKLPLVAGLALETVALAALVYLPDLPAFVLALLCFLIGFFGSCQIVCFALVKENHPVRH